MILKIEPFDTFFFRGGKGSLVGTEANATGVGLFPPPPSVWHGALRTAYFTEHPEALERANTAQDPTRNLEIKGVFLIDLNLWENDGNSKEGQKEKENRLAESLFLPTPFDILKDKDKTGKGEAKNIQYLKLKSELAVEKLKGQAYTSSPFLDTLTLDKDDTEEGAEHTPAEAAKNSWMSLSDFTNKYYSNQTEGLTLLTQNQFLAQEQKTGIKIDNQTQTAQEEHLYRVHFFRFKNAEGGAKSYAFAVWAEGLELPQSGFLKLGADSKPAAFERLKLEASLKSGESPQDIELPAPEIKNRDFRRFKVYLQTPAIFENGFLPRWVKDPQSQNGLCEYQGLKLRLLSAATGSYAPLGGFDMKANKPKPMRRALEAGSVFYFELFEPSPANAQRAIELFHLQAFTDLAVLPENAEILASAPGFGRSYLIPLD
jgi:CRISPR-associated protein Cmr3